MIVILYDKKNDTEHIEDISTKDMRQRYSFDVADEEVIYLEDCTRCLEPVMPGEKEKLYQYIRDTKMMIDKAREVYLYKSGSYYRIK